MNKVIDSRKGITALALIAVLSLAVPMEVKAAQDVIYYTSEAPKYPEITIEGYKGDSIFDGLKSFGYDATFAYRKELAKMIGIKNYKGTKKQNIKLLNTLKNSVIRFEPPVPEVIQPIEPSVLCK